MKRKPVRTSKSRRRKGTGKSRPKGHERIAPKRPDSVDTIVEASAQLVDEFPLPDHIEPAPVFYA
jgi:hypothetical protein